MSPRCHIPAVAPSRAARGRLVRLLGGLRRARGFTATELLVTLSILGTVSALATPSMTAALRRSLISASANDLQGAINRARTEAQRAGGAGMPYTVCASSGSTTPSTASCAGSWNQGVIVFSDTNGNGARDSGENVVLALPPMDPNVTVSVKSTLPYVLFAPNGMLHGGETGVRFTFNHAKAPFAADIQHLCVLRSGVEVVGNDALSSDTRHARCKAL
jgi:type IV fimbrial biogenesis protein FimT